MKTIIWRSESTSHDFMKLLSDQACDNFCKKAILSSWVKSHLGLLKFFKEQNKDTWISKLIILKIK